MEKTSASFKIVVLGEGKFYAFLRHTKNKNNKNKGDLLLSYSACG